MIGSGVVATGVSTLSFDEVKAAIIVSAVEGEASIEPPNLPEFEATSKKTKNKVKTVQFLPSFFIFVTTNLITYRGFQTVFGLDFTSANLHFV